MPPKRKEHSEEEDASKKAKSNEIETAVASTPVEPSPSTPAVSLASKRSPSPQKAPISVSKLSKDLPAAKKLSALDDFKDEDSRMDSSNKSRKPQEGSGMKVFLVPFILIIAEYFLRVTLDIPIATVLRNMMLPSTPPPVNGKYECNKETLADDVTIVVTVKDACSPAPGFIHSLHQIAPSNVHLIYTYPNFASCDTIPGFNEELSKFTYHTKLPLPIRVSPMKGWVEAVPHIKTKYAMLLHNDGYALDDFFLCELVEALKARENTTDENGKYVVAAPMIYESKADKSLAAHATQSNLRLVTEPNAKYGRTVRHDHSFSRALNRGSDFKEGPQNDFLEDHGFLIETDKIETIIDPDASYTLEYIDMIMTIKSNLWQVLFVPTARLEFRVTEFSWRDIPYFMYKRSEITCHGTRDYLSAKWHADFPNTGFWTYIKYTIVEQHIYNEKDLKDLTWSESATIAFGFFQMAGYNRYVDAVGSTQKVDFLTILEKLENGWQPSGPIQSYRNLVRKHWNVSDVKKPIKHIDKILPITTPKLINFEADMPLHYLPYVTLELKYSNIELLPKSIQPLCGLIIKHGKGGVGTSKNNQISCWINLPTFKSNNKFISFLDKFAALIKLPSRVTTFIELMMSSSVSAYEHMTPILDALREIDANSDSPDSVKAKFTICEHNHANCAATFEFSNTSRVIQFVGRPPSNIEVVNALLSSKK